MRDAGDLVSYTRQARRSMRGGLIGAAVGLALSGLALLAPPSYTAESTVAIEPLRADVYDSSQSAAALIDPATEVEIAQSDAVLELAVSRYGPFDVEELRPAVEVVPIEDSTVLTISVTADDPENAQLQADAVANAYLQHRGASANDRRDDFAEDLEQSIAMLDNERRQLGQRFKDSPKGSEARAQILVQHRATVAQRNALQAQLRSLRDLAPAGGDVLTSSRSTPPTVSPDRRLTVLSGVVGGGLLGFIVAFTRRQLGTRVREDEDLEKLGTLRFHAAVSAGRRGPVDGTEAFRALRERRKLDAQSASAPSTLFALDLRRSPRLDVALGLAQAIAQDRGNAAVLALGWQAEADGHQLDELSLRRVSQGRYVTAAGPQVSVETFERDGTGDDSDAFLTRAAATALATLASTGSAVVLWCPSSCSAATRLALLGRSDTYVLVLEPKRSGLAELRALASEATTAGASWVGAVLVR